MKKRSIQELDNERHILHENKVLLLEETGNCFDFEELEKMHFPSSLRVTGQRKWKTVGKVCLKVFFSIIDVYYFIFFWK